MHRMRRAGIGFSWRDINIPDIVTCSRVAEEVGFDSVWIPEAWGHDAFVTLTAIACGTSRIRLATGVVNVYSRSPAAIAMAIETLNHASEGRMILGLGTSAAPVIENWHGVRFESPLERTRDYIQIIRRILGGNRANHAGSVIRVSGFKLATPTTAKQVPIYLAAMGKRMLSLAGEIADGVLLYMIPFNAIPTAISTVEETARVAGRQPDAVDVAALIPTSVSDPPDEARQAVRRVLAYYVGGMGPYYYRSLARSGLRQDAEKIRTAWRNRDYQQATKAVSEELLDQLAAAGTPEQVRSKISDFARSGIGLPILTFPPPRVEGAQEIRKALPQLAEMLTEFTAS